MKADEHSTNELIAELRTLLGERLPSSRAACEQHGRGESVHPPRAPDAVVFPKSTAEVSAIVSRCAHYRMPVIAFGAGTSLEGHVAALRGGICVDLTGMDQV